MLEQISVKNDILTMKYHGEKRPLISVSNYGDVYLNDGDIIKIGKYFDVNDELKNWHVYTSNLIPYILYGFITNDKVINFVIDMLNGKYKTQLEYDKESIETIKENLPKEDLKFLKWQSNYYYPEIDYKYVDGLYYNISYHKHDLKNLNVKELEPITDENLAFSIYYNNYNLVPKKYYNLDNSEMYSKSIKLY